MKIEQCFQQTMSELEGLIHSILAIHPQGLFWCNGITIITI